jgi:hypothetical protein
MTAPFVLNQTLLETEKLYAPMDINSVLTASLEFRVFRAYGKEEKSSQHALYAEPEYPIYL